MDIEFGNLEALDTNGTGWFLGFSDWTKTNNNVEDVANLRFMARDTPARTIQAKWMRHLANDDRGTAKPPSEGRTLSILVSHSGCFRLEFSLNEHFTPEQTCQHILQKHGDFVVWGEHIYHRWFVDQACTILTFRWVPV